MEFYDGTKLLSMKDENGLLPEVYVSTSNRLAGKTTYFNRWRIKKFIKAKEKTMWVYRTQGELESVSEKIFKELNHLFFPTRTMTHKIKDGKKYADLFLDGRHMGYAVALNSADAIKNASQKFIDTGCMIMDEFQANKYIPREVYKFNILHASVARGGGERIRRVPVVFIGNALSLLNPYYVSMGVSSRLTSNAKFIRGDGYVIEQNYNKSASDGLKGSGFHRALGSSYDGAAEMVYTEGYAKTIKKFPGKGKYILGVLYEGKYYCVRLGDDGICYMCKGYDPNNQHLLTISKEDVSSGLPTPKANKITMLFLRDSFHKGLFRFGGFEEREAAIALLSY